MSNDQPGANSNCNEEPVRRLLDCTNGVQSGPARRGRPSMPIVCRPSGTSPQEGSDVSVDGVTERVGENHDPNTDTRQKGPQRRFWVFTSNTAEDPKLLQVISVGLEAFDSSVRYIVFQKERGEKESREHFQGYVEFTKTYRLNEVRKRISATAHFEPRRGSATQAIAYCRKEDTRIDGPWEFGVRSKGQGTRSDLIALRDAIEKGKKRKELYESHTVTMVKYPKFYDGYRLALQEEGWRRVECIMLIGETGTGKTRWVYDNWLVKGLWRLPMVTSGLWFDTYDRETHVLLDDFAGAASKVSLSSLLQILDGYWIKVPIKGGFTWWGPTHIAVTTNVEVKDWYKWDRRAHQYMCLARRFTKIVQFHGQDVTEYVSSEYFHADDIE